MALFGKKNNDENTPNPIPESTPEENTEPVIAEAGEEKKPEFHTPEGFDFNRYFLAERRIVLENISYEVQRPMQGQLKLNVKDTIVAQVVGQAGVKVTYNRDLRFEPEGPFTLSVSFGVMLVFNPGTKNEIDWKTVDVAAEFRKSCPQIVDAMSSRAALLVAEITAANGGNPLILKR